MNFLDGKVKIYGNNELVENRVCEGLQNATLFNTNPIKGEPVTVHYNCKNGAAAHSITQNYAILMSVLLTVIACLVQKP